MIWVTPHSKLSSTLRKSGARKVIAFASPGTEFVKPDDVAIKDCLVLTMNDIAEPIPGLVLPHREQVTALLEFVCTQDRKSAVVLTCYAGVSRSTAAAYILLCHRQPGHDEAALAALLRRRAPFATPNAKLIALADELLKRDGRMSAAIQAIGRGVDAFEGVPFEIG